MRYFLITQYTCRAKCFEISHFMFHRNKRTERSRSKFLQHHFICFKFQHKIVVKIIFFYFFGLLIDLMKCHKDKISYLLKAPWKNRDITSRKNVEPVQLASAVCSFRKIPFRLHKRPMPVVSPIIKGMLCRNILFC